MEAEEDPIKKTINSYIFTNIVFTVVQGIIPGNCFEFVQFVWRVPLIDLK